MSVKAAAHLRENAITDLGEPNGVPESSKRTQSGNGHSKYRGDRQ